MTAELVPLPQSNPVKIPGKRSSRPRGVPELHRVTKEEIDRSQEPFQPGGTRRGNHHALLVRFLWVTGCRISEAMAVTPQDFDFGALSVRLVTRKRRGMHFRALPLPPGFCGQLAQWLLFARPGPDERIFPWGRTRAYEIVRQVLEAGGVDRRRAHPHAVRHGHAFHALANAVPVNALQAALGHSHLSTTAIYTRATGADLRASYERVQW